MYESDYFAANDCHSLGTRTVALLTTQRAAKTSTHSLAIGASHPHEREHPGPYKNYALQPRCQTSAARNPLCPQSSTPGLIALAQTEPNVDLAISDNVISTKTFPKPGERSPAPMTYVPVRGQTCGTIAHRPHQRVRDFQSARGLAPSSRCRRCGGMRVSRGALDLVLHPHGVEVVPPSLTAREPGSPRPGSAFKIPHPRFQIRPRQTH